METLSVGVVGRSRSTKISVPLQKAGIEVELLELKPGTPSAKIRKDISHQFDSNNIDAFFVDSPGLVAHAHFTTPNIPVMLRLRGDPRLDRYPGRIPRRSIEKIHDAWDRILFFKSPKRKKRFPDATVPVGAWLESSIKHRGWPNVLKSVELPYFPPDPSSVELPAGPVVMSITNFNYGAKAKAARDVWVDLDQSLPSDVKIWIAGEGKYRDSAMKNAPDRCMFPGHVDGAAALIPKASIFTYGTYGDAYPSILLEARAAGAPIVANNHPAVSEQIDNQVNGVLVGNHRSVRGIGKAAATLLENPELRKCLGRAAANTVLLNNTPKAVGKLLRDRITECLSNC